MEVNNILTKDQFLALKAAWKQLEQTDDIKAEDVILYNVLRGKDKKNGFHPTSNPNRIQGNDPWFEFKRAEEKLNHEYFVPRHGDKVYYAGKFITKAEFQEIRQAKFKARYGIDLSVEVVEALG